MTFWIKFPSLIMIIIHAYVYPNENVLDTLQRSHVQNYWPLHISLTLYQILLFPSHINCWSYHLFFNIFMDKFLFMYTERGSFSWAVCLTNPDVDIVTTWRIKQEAQWTYNTHLSCLFLDLIVSEIYILLHVYESQDPPQDVAKAWLAGLTMHCYILNIEAATLVV